jgi:hypothetical protein
MTWHVDSTLLERWIEGSDGATSGASVEQHLLHCADCRALVPRPRDLDEVWARVRDEVELPTPSWLERSLVRLGLNASDARVVAVSPMFRGAWLSGLSLVLAFAAAAGMWGTDRGLALFLLVAPLVPAAGVALGYDPETEPALEQECATPWPRFRLVLLRSVSLLLTGLPLVAAVSLVVPGRLALLWWVPAAALTVAVLALSTWVAPLVAAGGVSLLWLGVVGAVGRQPEQAVDESYLLGYAVLAVVATAVLLLRRSRLGELPWDPR